MSKKGYLEDSDCDGEVDFDFFDSPKDPPRSKLSPKESKNDPMETKHAKPESVPVSDSSDSERSGPVTRASVKKIEATVPVLTTASHDYSDSFESDSAGGDESEEDAKPKSKPELKKNARVSQKKAWESSERWKSATAKSENHSRSTSNGKSKPPPKSKSRKSDHIRVISDESSEISTDSDTDSDVTEVSPLGSPRTRNGHDMYDMRELAKLGKPPRSPMHKETVSYHKPTRPTSAKTKESNKLDKLLNADSDSMDLQLLMQAVLEMEQDREKRQRQQRRVLFAPPPKAKPQSKLNQTFSNDKVRTIDRENQRLMQRIMGMAKEAEATKTKIKKPKYAHREPPKLTPSAVNRLSEQRRIERENLVRTLFSTFLFIVHFVSSSNFVPSYSVRTCHNYYGG